MRYDAFGTADEAKTQTLYDLAGNVAEVRSPRYFDASDPQAAYMRTTFAYNGQNQQSSQTRAAGSSIQNTTSQTYDIKGRPLVSTDANNKLWTNDYNNDCCDRFQGRIDPLGHGSFSNQDKLGRVVHTAIVQDYSSHSDKLNPIDAKTFGETTTRFDPMGRPSATTVWLVPRGTINLDNPPIAGLDGIAASEGLTTQTYYDSNMKDGVGFDSAGGVTIQKLGGGTYNLSLNAVMAKAALGESSGGAGSTFNPERSAPSAVVSINPEEELSVTITDGLGRHVISAQLQPWDGPQPFAIITWNCSVYDQTATIAGMGTVLESRSVDPLGFVTKTRTDGGGRTLESYDQENFKTSFTHDPNGNTLSVRDPNGVGYDAAFDNLNRQTSQTDTFGVTTSQVFDKEGNVTKQFDGKGNFTRFAFDALNRRKTVTDRLNGVTTFGYTPTSQLSALTDAENQSTLYDYNDRGEKTKETYPDHVLGSTPGTAGYGIVEFAYDPAGRTKLKTDQMGDTCTFNHDLAGRMLQRDYRTFANSPSGAIADSDVFTFDRASRMLTGHSGRYNNDVGMGYDFGGRLSSESLTIAGQTYSVGRAYDARGLEASMTYPNGSLVERTYSPRQQLHQTKYLGVVVDARTYDSGGRHATSTYANGAVTTNAYRLDNLLSSRATTHAGTEQIGTYSYTWDANKNKTGEAITGTMSGYGFTVPTSGGYDAEDRVTAWNRTDGNKNQSWNLSLVGDWNTHVDAGVTQTRTHGPAHEFTSVTIGGIPHALSYDPKGNMLTRPAALSAPALNLVWDFENQLKGADIDNTPASLEVTFEFDALGRRVARNEGASQVIFVQAGQQTIADYARTAAPSSPSYRYVYASYIDEPILRHAGTLSTLPTSGSDVIYFHRNQQYSITALTDVAGNLLERYAYTGYGVMSIFASNGTIRNSSSYENFRMHRGYGFDIEMAVYFSTRSTWFDPATGTSFSRTVETTYYSTDPMQEDDAEAVSLDELELWISTSASGVEFDGIFGYGIKVNYSLNGSGYKSGKRKRPIAMAGSQFWQLTKIMQRIVLQNENTGELREAEVGEFWQGDVQDILPGNKNSPIGHTPLPWDPDEQDLQAWSINKQHNGIRFPSEYKPYVPPAGFEVVFAYQYRTVESGLRPFSRRANGVWDFDEGALTPGFYPNVDPVMRARLEKMTQSNGGVRGTKPDPHSTANIFYLFAKKTCPVDYRKQFLALIEKDRAEYLPDHILDLNVDSWPDAVEYGRYYARNNKGRRTTKWWIYPRSIASKTDNKD